MHVQAWPFRPLTHVALIWKSNCLSLLAQNVFSVKPFPSEFTKLYSSIALGRGGGIIVSSTDVIPASITKLPVNFEHIFKNLSWGELPLPREIATAHIHENQQFEIVELVSQGDWWSVYQQGNAHVLSSSVHAAPSCLKNIKLKGSRTFKDTHMRKSLTMW